MASSKVSYEINELVISTNKQKRQVNRLLIRKRRLINVNILISGKISIPFGKYIHFSWIVLMKIQDFNYRMMVNRK